jgi:hypothetical protein
MRSSTGAGSAKAHGVIASAIKAAASKGNRQVMRRS